MKFGEYLKHRRIEVLRETLREFCRARGLDAGNLSRIERGVSFPRARLAKALCREYGIPENSTEAPVVYLREQAERAGIAFGES